jgi:hypothetical protein
VVAVSFYFTIKIYELLLSVFVSQFFFVVTKYLSKTT